MSIWNAIGIGGDILGGIMGHKKEERWRDEDQERQDNQLQRLVEDAKKAGLSPLAALGSSAAGQFGSPVGGQPGNYLGQAVSNAANTWAGRRAERLQLDNMKKQNDLLDAQIANINAETVAARSRSLIPTAATAAETDALLDLYVRARDPRTGQKGWIVNPELSDVEQGALAAAWHGLNPWSDPAPEESISPRARPGSIRPRRAPSIRVKTLPPTPWSESPWEMKVR